MFFFFYNIFPAKFGSDFFPPEKSVPPPAHTHIKIRLFVPHQPFLMVMMCQNILHPEHFDRLSFRLRNSPDNFALE